MDEQLICLTVPAELAGRRLDQALAWLCPQFSRARLQSWIKAKRVRVDGRLARQRDIVRAGQRLRLVPAPDKGNDSKGNHIWAAEALPLDIIHEDEHIIVLNKPAGLVVHPGAGNPAATLLNALLHHHAALRTLPRAGIVQRLDKDTSGIMIIAKTPTAHARLTADLRRRRIERCYRALVHGELSGGGRIEQAIGRHPLHRLKMAVVENGKPAVTHYRIAGRYHGITELQVRLETGRTHQIRVHLAHIRHAVVGDPLYARRNPLPKGISPPLRTAIQGFARQALHAEALRLAHPVTGAEQYWKAPPPADYQALLAMIKHANR